MSLSVLKSFVIGIGGSLVLLLFFSTFLSLEKSVSLMPGILGFNGLVLGYGLVDRIRSRISNYNLFSFVMGLGEGAGVFVVLKLMETFLRSGVTPTGVDLLIYMFVSGVTSFLGARLAVRYFNL